MQDTKIEWSDMSWNPTYGCTKVSPGCDNCYAETISKRFGRSFDLSLKPHKLNEPMKIKESKRIFVNSMSDLFHKDVPASYLDQVFGVMEKCDWHTFIILTKRSSLMRNYVNARYGNQFAPHHIWLGCSMENKQMVKTRLPHLLETRARVRVISAEPLLEAIHEDLDLRGIHWMIVGGESGHGFRPMKERWANGIRLACKKSGTAFFFKQFGGRTPKAGGNHLGKGKSRKQYLAYPDVEKVVLSPFRLPKTSYVEYDPTYTDEQAGDISHLSGRAYRAWITMLHNAISMQWSKIELHISQDRKRLPESLERSIHLHPDLWTAYQNLISRYLADDDLFIATADSMRYQDQKVEHLWRLNS